MKIDDQLRLSRNLKTLRMTAKMSQSDLAKKIGLCRSSYCQVEQGDRLPDLGTLYSISKIYHVAMDTLVGSDVQTILGAYFLRQDNTREEMQLMRVYSRLSDVSKGRLLERAEELAELDLLRRKDLIQADY